MRDNNRYDVTITRKTYEVKTVSYEMLDDNIGYIAITNFRTATINQFQSAFQELENQGANRFIFDVRDNGGGLLTALSEILDPLLPEGDIAESTDGDGNTEVIVTSDAECVDYPMVVLVNESTASAAELFACSLRDFANASLIGVQTYGKGVIQETSQLSNGGAITLTTATYKTTVSDCYNEIGLVPDEVVESNDDDDITSVDKNKDAQLKKAIEVVKNK
jgi:carboxyl-terminal processing protease